MKHAAAAIALSAAILSPLAMPEGWDSFPISSYPMFSRGNLGRRVTLGHALLVHADGTRAPAPPALVGTPEPMVAKNVIENAIAAGRAGDLCAAIASRAKGAVAVEIATSTFDSRAYFEGSRAPLERTVHASCPVP